MYVDCQPKEPHAQSAAGKFAKMHIMKGFENIIVQYDWRIYKYKVSTTLTIQWSTEQKSTKQSSN